MFIDLPLGYAGWAQVTGCGVAGSYTTAYPTGSCNPMSGTFGMFTATSTAISIQFFTDATCTTAAGAATAMYTVGTCPAAVPDDGLLPVASIKTTTGATIPTPSSAAGLLTK